MRGHKCSSTARQAVPVARARIRGREKPTRLLPAPLPPQLVLVLLLLVAPLLLALPQLLGRPSLG